MRKINKLLNITLIFMLALVFSTENCAYSMDISALRVPMGVSRERILQAAANEDIEDIIKRAVLIHRIGLLRYLGGAYDNPFSPGALEYEGPCSEASADVGKILMFLKRGEKNVEIFRYQASRIFESHKHLFTVLRYKDKYYLIDTTFIQFFNGVHERAQDIIAEKLFGYKSLFYPWHVLRESKKQKWAEMAGRLLKNGYIELTDESANMYGSLLRGRIPADRVFNKGNIIKSPIAESDYSDVELSGIFGDTAERISLAGDPEQLGRLDEFLRESLTAIPRKTALIVRERAGISALSDKLKAGAASQNDL